jgi:hypothetical protein
MCRATPTRMANMRTTRADRVSHLRQRVAEGFDPDKADGPDGSADLGALARMSVIGSLA